MKVTIKLEKDDVRNSFIYLNALSTHLALTDLAEDIRAMRKYGTEKTKEEILDYVYEELNNILLIDMRDEPII